jgi:monothiol glutaredoxin
MADMTITTTFYFIADFKTYHAWLLINSASRTIQLQLNRVRRLAMDIMETIKDQIENNRVILYMKGSPNQPQCGFSARTVQALMGCGQKFAYVDVLSNPEIRANLPTYGNWPTFPQLWVDGELVGGCDIVCDMDETGELRELIVGEGGSES